jgi:hypothetical protein
MPFWLSCVLALLGIIYFSYFVEAVVLFFLTDLLYGARETKFSGIIFISLIVSAVTLVVVEFFKKKLKFYS